MNETTLIALCAADLSLTVTKYHNRWEVRWWYEDDYGFPVFDVEYSGDWDDCMGYMRTRWEEHENNRIGYRLEAMNHDDQDHGTAHLR